NPAVRGIEPKSSRLAQPIYMTVIAGLRPGDPVFQSVSDGSPGSGMLNPPLSRRTTVNHGAARRAPARAALRPALLFASALNAEQFDVENQGRVRRDDAAGPPRAIPQFRRNDQVAVATHRHGGGAFITASIPRVLPERE